MNTKNWGNDSTSNLVQAHRHAVCVRRILMNASGTGRFCYATSILKQNMKFRNDNWCKCCTHVPLLTQPPNLGLIGLNCQHVTLTRNMHQHQSTQWSGQTQTSGLRQRCYSQQKGLWEHFILKKMFKQSHYSGCQHLRDSHF